MQYLNTIIFDNVAKLVTIFHFLIFSTNHGVFYGFAGFSNLQIKIFLFCEKHVFYLNIGFLITNTLRNVNHIVHISCSIDFIKICSCKKSTTTTMIAMVLGYVNYRIALNFFTKPINQPWQIVYMMMR